MDAIVNAMLEDNVRKVLRDGPRARTDYNTPVLARDRKLGRVLVGGIGCMGVGQIWQDERPDHADYPGFDNAPEQSAPPMGQP